MDIFPSLGATHTPNVCYTDYAAERSWKSVVEEASEQQPLRLSVIVLAYEMTREIPRTLCSLSRTYQEGAADLDYEVLLIDNGSPVPLDPATWAHIDVPVQTLRIEEAQLIGMQGFHRSLGAYRHEDRGLDRSVGGSEPAAAGLGGGVVSEKLEHW